MFPENDSKDNSDSENKDTVKNHCRFEGSLGRFLDSGERPLKKGKLSIKIPQITLKAPENNRRETLPVNSMISLRFLKK